MGELRDIAVSAVLDRHRHAEPTVFGKRGGEVLIPPAQPGVGCRSERAGGHLFGQESADLATQLVR